MNAVAALEGSVLGEFMRASSWAYPLVNLVHVAGLVLLVGSMLLLDLRLMGVGRQVASLQHASAVLTPLAFAGLWLLLVSGFLLFAADAKPLLSNPLFLPKLALIVSGIVNALLFRHFWTTRIESGLAQLPLLARLQAGFSLVIWVGAAILGRLLAYV